MSASGYFAMYGSGSFSLHANNPSGTLHVPCASLQPHHLSRLPILHACNMRLSAAAAQLVLGARGKEQICYAHQTVSTSDTSMSKPISVKVSIRWIFSRPCTAHIRCFTANLCT